ncbi:hypothetical protein ACFUNF_05975 [Streptomyces sp. NPDC057291]
MSLKETSWSQRGDEAYLVLIGHTVGCALCRVEASCPTALRLARAWREAR